MNTLGPILLGSMAHATGFALVAALFYLAWRRYSPAAGALAAGSSLVIMALVSLLVLGPWPDWWDFVPDPSGQKTATSGRASHESPESPRLKPQRELTTTSTESVPKAPRFESPLNGRSATPGWTRIFAAELSRELRRPAALSDTTGWRWPEWVAAGFFAGLGLGIARLVLGTWAIRRLRARSLPVDDRGLYDAIDVVRAEMSCSRKVEVRETAELTTAATIGWQRPVLLLPADWRDWNEAERLAILAHEVAHVRRGDFVAGLLAQLCLALHFYHPLAHWLAARLRLEQELAADAWATRLAGGKPAYLATLAQIALRRDGRSVTWPARAFLPCRGTFVRRIEMLRNTNPIRHASLSRAARGLTLGTLLGLGLLVAGLRWPAARDAAWAQQPAPTDGVTRKAGNESFNLAFLPADAKMVLAIRPKALLERREFRTLWERTKETKSLHAIAARLIEENDQLLAFWEGSPQAPAEPGRVPMVPPPSGIVLRMAKPQDWNPILNQLLIARREVRHAGQTYLTAEGSLAAPFAGAAFAADDRTLVIAPEELLRELIEDRNAPAPRHSWDEAWQKVAKGQIMLALDVRWVRRRLAQGLRGGPGDSRQSPAGNVTLDAISPLLEKTQSYALSIDTSDGVVVDLVGFAGSENDAKPVADTISALATLARNAVGGMRQDLRRQPAATGEAIEWALQAADTLLDKTRIEMAANLVHVQSKTSLDIGEAVKLLAPAVSAAQTASRRVQSVNNLKQITLAIHNYVSVNDNHFPTPILYGGKNKSIPYSWRIAILPYLYPNDLYSQYNFDEPWDGPNNRKLIDKMPSIYSYPGPTGGPVSQTNSSYFVLTGEATAFGAIARGKERANTFLDIHDGSSNTIMVVEGKREIPWTKPEDIPFEPNAPLPELGGFASDVFNAAFADGSVRSISYKVNPSVLKALITRAGGEVISLDSFGAEPTRRPRAKP